MGVEGHLHANDRSTVAAAVPSAVAHCLQRNNLSNYNPLHIVLPHEVKRATRANQVIPNPCWTVLAQAKRGPPFNTSTPAATVSGHTCTRQHEVTLHVQTQRTANLHASVRVGTKLSTTPLPPDSTTNWNTLTEAVVAVVQPQHQPQKNKVESSTIYCNVACDAGRRHH